MLLRCGEQYRRRYVQGERIPPSASLIRGRCGHKAEEKNFIQKITTGADLPSEAVKDYFNDEWKESRYQISWTSAELQGESPRKAEGRFKDSGVRLVEVFHSEQAPQCQPVEVEREITVKFQGGFPDLLTRIDRIDKGDIIGEMKFVSKSPQKDDASTDIQLTVEDFAFRQEYGKPPIGMMKQWAIDTKTPKTEVQKVPARDESTINRLLHRLHAGMKAIERGDFLPAPIGVWWCSERFCGYWRTCKFKP